jgi:hypothetical protein
VQSTRQKFRDFLVQSIDTFQRSEERRVLTLMAQFEKTTKFRLTQVGVRVFFLPCL